MATSFNKRLFGTDLDPEIKNKLRARQILAKHSVIPGQSSEFIEIDGQEHKVSDLIGNVNFGGKNPNLSLAEMSSRTPFARMWTAVEVYYSQPAIYGDDYGRIDWKLSGWGKKGIHSKTHKWEAKISEDKIQEAKQMEFEKKVYVVNNHHLNTFQNNTANPHDSMLLGKDGAAAILPNVPVSTGADLFPEEGHDNRYMKPPAGITNISSKTEGAIGAIKRTTVSFKVWNFNDFDTIYSRYFLRPGALIFIDIGWDTAEMYDPYSIVKNHINGETSIHDFLYGNGEKQIKGIVEKSKGDLDVLVGRVVDWSAKATRDGGWDCTVEIVSENEGLLDHEVSEQNLMKQKFVKGLAPLVINQAARLVGQNFLRTDWMSSPLDLEESTAYAMKFAKAAFSGTGNTNECRVDNIAEKVGVYFQKTFTNAEAEELLKTVDKGDISGDMEEGKLNKGIDPNLHEIQNIYVAWGFFEDEILNKTLSLGFNENYEISGRFDSSQSFVSFNKMLYQRQKLNAAQIEDRRHLKWLFPETGKKYYNTYSSIHDKMADYSKEGSICDNLTPRECDNKLNRVPLREIFVNLKIIQEAFDEVNSVNEAIKKILSEMNSFSFDIWDLQLTSLTRDNSVLSVVDRNMIEENKRTTDFYDTLFQFKPHDAESIVKDFDMSFTTPKNGLQNMIAIGNTGYNNPIYPLTPDEELNNALRNIMREGNQLGTRSFPSINETQYLNENTIFNNNPIPTNMDKTFLGGGTGGVENLKQAYQEISQIISDGMEEESRSKLKEAYMGLNDYDHDFDDMWGGAYAKNKLAVMRGEEEEDIPGYDTDVAYSAAGSLVASDLEEYFGYKAKTQYLHTNLSSILPIDLSLSLYGISGIHPGDLFKVDWMPKRYREVVYFQVVGVSQEISNNSWTTKIETVMRIRLDKKDSNLYLKPRQILLSNNFFQNMGMPSGVTKAFTNIEPIHWNDKFVGCTARGSHAAGGGPMKKMKIYMNSSWEDTYQQFETGTITQKFIQKFIDFAGSYKPAGKATLAKMFGWRHTSTDTEYVEIQGGDHFYIVMCFQGVIVFDRTFATQYGSQPPNNETIFNLIKSTWNNTDKDWKKQYEDGKYQYVGGGYITPQ